MDEMIKIIQANEYDEADNDAENIAKALRKKGYGNLKKFVEELKENKVIISGEYLGSEDLETVPIRDIDELLKEYFNVAGGSHFEVDYDATAEKLTQAHYGNLLEFVKWLKGKGQTHFDYSDYIDTDDLDGLLKEYLNEKTD